MDRNDRKDIRTLTREQLRAFFAEKGWGAYRGGQVHRWLWQKGATDFAQMTDLPASVREALGQEFYIRRIAAVTSQVSEDGTVKNAIRLDDGAVVESVLIPSEDRTTVCVSCQSGCRMGCAFCATARMGGVRDLSAGEIYDQVTLAEAQSRERFGRGLSNIVFMGMGEPTANYAEVSRAIGLITSEEGLGMAGHRITVSTAGNARMIRQMADQGAKFHLAISLHWAVQQRRETIMPVAKAFPLAELAEAAAYWYARTRDRVTYEYIVWDGLNDTREDAEALVRFCRRAPSESQPDRIQRHRRCPFSGGETAGDADVPAGAGAGWDYRSGAVFQGTGHRCGMRPVGRAGESERMIIFTPFRAGKMQEKTSLWVQSR